MNEASQKTDLSVSKKAIALLSGGLDSALAAKLIKDQGIEVIGLHFLSPFGCQSKVEQVAVEIGIRLILKHKGEALLDLIKNPQYGYGSQMNPCIDCRIMMFQMAKQVMHAEQAHFIVTGEVLGQRPMSQRRQAMELIDRKSEMGGLLLRPLSAHHFPPTVPEKEGWIDRASLLQIRGRGRKEQFSLVQKSGITSYTTPAGGCLLTDAGFSLKLRDYLLHEDNEVGSQARLARTELLRFGRYLRLSDRHKVIVARNESECSELTERWKHTHTTFFYPKNFSGPVAVGFGGFDEQQRMLIARILFRYGKSPDQARAEISFESAEGNGTLTVDEPISESALGALRVG